ncbi:MAG: hypothetical protein WC568_10745 [Candidatus Methanoperedens sp.]
MKKQNIFLTIALVFVVIIFSYFFVLTTIKNTQNNIEITLNNKNITIYNNLIDNTTLDVLINKTNKTYLNSKISGILFLNMGNYSVKFSDNNFIPITIKIDNSIDRTKDTDTVGTTVTNPLIKPFIVITSMKNCDRIFCQPEFTYLHEVGHIYFLSLNDTERSSFIISFEKGHEFIRNYSNNSPEEYYADSFALSNI